MVVHSSHPFSLSMEGSGAVLHRRDIISSMLTEACCLPHTNLLDQPIERAGRLAVMQAHAAAVRKRPLRKVRQFLPDREAVQRREHRGKTI